MRLLIIIILAWLGFRALKRWMASGLPKADERAGRAIDDMMVQDPVCGVFFPKQQGVSIRSGKKVLYFCSEDCRSKYIKERGEKEE